MAENAFIQWQEEQETLHLEGLPMLSYRMTYPILHEFGGKETRINRFYRRLGDSWQTRWRTTLYTRACIQASQSQAQSRPFSPWTAECGGTACLLPDHLYSLHLNAWERGVGGTKAVQQGHLWHIEKGIPLNLSTLTEGRGWRKKLLAQAKIQAEQSSHNLILQGDWIEYLPQFRGFYISEEGFSLLYPQDTIALAEAGAVALPLGWDVPLKSQYLQLQR